MEYSQITIFDKMNDTNTSLDKLKSIDLNKNGIQVFYGCLSLHDYLWFSSTEISKISTTIPVIHNYALSYALNQFSYAIFFGNTPRYEEDFKRFKCYATPSISFGSHRETITYNALNDLKQTPGQSKINTPNYGWKNVVVPNYFSKEEKDNLYAFKFFVFTLNGYKLPSLIRLGKKGATCRVFWEELEKPIAKFSEKCLLPSHPINPLDVRGEVIRGGIVKIPPHSFYRVVTIKNDWFIFHSSKTVHIPKIVLERIDAN